MRSLRYYQDTLFFYFAFFLFVITAFFQIGFSSPFSGAIPILEKKYYGRDRSLRTVPILEKKYYGRDRRLSYPLRAEKKGPDALAVSLKQKAGGFSAVSQT